MCGTRLVGERYVVAPIYRDAQEFNKFLFMQTQEVMNRQAILICRASILQHKLLKDLPFAARVASLTRFATDPADIFGRMFYTIFLQRHIQGLPDIGGKPALDFDLTRAPQHLVPLGYGKDFGHSAMAFLMYKFHDPEMVQDIMQDVALRFLKNPEMLHEGAPLSDARGYVMTSLVNACKRALTLRSRHPGDYGHGVPNLDMEDGKDLIDRLEDPKALQTVLKWIDDEAGASVLNRMMQDLKKIRGAVPYVQGKLDTGLPDIRLVGDTTKGIPAQVAWFSENAVDYGNFSTNIKPKIKKVLEKYVNAIRD